MKKIEKKIVANNKKAYFDYFIEEKLEAGLVLRGTEVKSLKEGTASIKEAYVKIDNNEVFIINMYIKNYEKGNIFNADERIPRKLLLNKSEIRKLQSSISEDGYTIAPLEVYFNEENRAKVLIGVAKGKKNYDKRNTLKEKDQKRAIDKAMKTYNK